MTVYWEASPVSPVYRDDETDIVITDLKTGKELERIVKPVDNAGIPLNMYERRSAIALHDIGELLGEVDPNYYGAFIRKNTPVTAALHYDGKMCVIKGEKILLYNLELGKDIALV